MEYKRNCPACKKELSYTDGSNFKRAVKNNSVCANCRKMPESLKTTLSEYWTGRKNPNYKRRAKEERPDNYVRNCPDCGEKISYVKNWAYSQAIKNNTKCPKCVISTRMKKTGVTYILTQDQINKMAATKAGYDSWEEYQANIPEFEKYRKQVWSITSKQPLEKLKNFEKRGRLGVEGAFNIDHIYSIHKGFMTGIDPVIIGNIDNLRMIPWLENIKKHKN